MKADPAPGNPPEPLVRAPSLRLVSSLGLGWRGIAVERHRAAPGERSETTTAHHVIELASGRQVAYGERPDRCGRLMPYTKEPGTLFSLPKACFRSSSHPPTRS